jgi:hypothetical protein
MPALPRNAQPIATLRWATLAFLLFTSAASFAQVPVHVDVDWSKSIATTRTTITLQVVENPPLRGGSPIHDAAWANLAALHTDMTRLALWYPYPRLAVAELAPPAAATTSWDFTHIDPIVDDFMHATSGHTSVFTMSTIPTWMFKEADPGPIPPSPDEAVWNYEGGAILRDPSGKEVADYFAQVAGWYTAGGFTDGRGSRHASTHHYNMPWWEILNEPEYEHALNIETYTHLYDRIVTAVRAVTPATRFVGMSLAEPTRSPASFEYFLNPANHAPGVPLDAISYHFYADAEPGESDATQTFTFFARTDAFLNSVRYIESIRKRLSPRTQTHINEAGCIAADDLAQGAAHTGELPSAQYWDLCGAVFAYLYAGLAEQGIDVLGASQLLGYPSQFPSVTLLDWRTGQPNARYRVLQLLHENFGPGDRIVQTSLHSSDVYAAAYITPHAVRKLLLINKRSHPIDIEIAGSTGATTQSVDTTSAAKITTNPPLTSDKIHLEGLSVTVATLPTHQ